VNSDPLRQLLLVLVNRIEEVTTEYSQAFALQHFSAAISELGQKHALPRCSIAVRFTSINGHQHEWRRALW
jgi:hypothetical protein